MLLWRRQSSRLTRCGEMLHTCPSGLPQPCCSVHLQPALLQLKEEHCATARGMAAFSLPGRFRSIKWALVEAFSCGCSVCRYQSLSC